MEIEVKFLCRQIVREMKSGVYSVPENSTVRELITHCEKENNIYISPEHYQWLAFLADGLSADWDMPLAGVRKLHVINVAFGG